MSTPSVASAPPAHSPFITPDALLAHWQGHRRLTRRVIAAFPEDQFNTFSIGGMRPFGALAAEMLGIGAPMLRGVVTGEWEQTWDRPAPARDELLRRWDAATAEIDALWAQVAPERFLQHITTFGTYEGPLYDQVLYAIDNEIHHRGQGTVYLRALGIEPPAFYDRS